MGTVRTMSTMDTLVSQRRVAADLNQRVSDSAKEVTTGMKADVFRALGVRASEALAIRAGMTRNETFIASNEMLASRLDLTALTLRQARETAQSFLNLAVSNVTDPTQTAGELQRAAQMALDRLTGQLNATFRGVPLFAGTDSARLPLTLWDADSDDSPRKVVVRTIGAGIADAADGEAKADLLRRIYSSDPTVPQSDRYEGSFFSGTPLRDVNGTALPRVSARIDATTILEHGVQANDPAMTDVLRGLAMLAATDVTKITDPDAYRIWMGKAVDALSGGIAGMTDIESRLGSQQQSLGQMMTLQRDRQVLFNSQVLVLEGVDPYEAATRLNQVQTQLEATYAVTSRLSRLSFLNFM